MQNGEIKYTTERKSDNFKIKRELLEYYKDQSHVTYQRKI
jgi:hypothetical protein